MRRLPEGAVLPRVFPEVSGRAGGQPAGRYTGALPGDDRNWTAGA